MFTTKLGTIELVHIMPSDHPKHFLWNHLTVALYVRAPIPAEFLVARLLGLILVRIFSSHLASYVLFNLLRHPSIRMHSHFLHPSLISMEAVSLNFRTHIADVI